MLSRLGSMSEFGGSPVKHDGSILSASHWSKITVADGLSGVSEIIACRFSEYAPMPTLGHQPESVEIRQPSATVHEARLLYYDARRAAPRHSLAVALLRAPSNYLTLLRMRLSS
jgi:hypothetical protein